MITNIDRKKLESGLAWASRKIEMFRDHGDTHSFLFAQDSLDAAEILLMLYTENRELRFAITQAKRDVLEDVADALSKQTERYEPK